MLLSKKKNQSASKGNRLLISITVLGSAGPIRFVVNEEDLVSAVMDIALKSYARQGRLPILGSDPNDFMFYCPSAATEVLSPWESIGSVGFRDFMLCKKPQTEKPPMTPSPRKSVGNWKAWFNKSLKLKVTSH